MASDEQDQTSLPVDFTVYGLDATFDGARWVDFFEGRPGSPPWALWLGHRAAGGNRGVRVGTMPRERYAEVMCPNGRDPLVEVAFSGAFGLVNLTLPDVSVPRPDGLIQALVEHAEKQAKRYRKWRPVWWDVGGVMARAKVWDFAGAWAGFTDTPAEAYVVAVGIGVKAEDLKLVSVESKAYGADFRKRLDLGELGRQRSTRPDAWLPPPQRNAFHADQLALVPRSS